MDTHLTDPTLTAGPFRIRPWLMTDVDVIEAAAADPYITLIAGVPGRFSREASHAYVQRQWERSLAGEGFSVVIAEAGTDRAVGQIQLGVHDLAHQRGSLEYWVAPPFRRRGGARHALAVMSRWGFTMLGLQRLEVCAEPWNEAAAATARSTGYQYEGILRAWRTLGDERRDVAIYSLLVGDALNPP